MRPCRDTYPCTSEYVKINIPVWMHTQINENEKLNENLRRKRNIEIK
jgi:hypothetical protein